VNDGFFTEDSKRKGVITSILDKLGMLEKFMLNHGGALHLNAPNRALWLGEQLTKVSGAFTLTLYLDPLQIMNGAWYNNPNANGDSFSLSAMLRAGAYIFSTTAMTNDNRGKIDWYLDGTLIKSGEDWYSAALTYNVVKTFAFTVPLTGYHVFKGVINGKNGASSAYIFSATYIHVKQASD
jgi:hypothetical protein